MIVMIVIVVFIIIWGSIIYEIRKAPLFDENEMPIDIKKEDVDDNLWDKNHIEDMDK